MNTTNIFFDFNPPVSSNTASTKIIEPLGVPNHNVASFQLILNPASTAVAIQSKEPVAKIELFNHLGQLLKVELTAYN